LRATDLLPSYSFIVLQIGANDILQNRALVDIEEDLRGLLRFSRERSPHVFLMTAGNVGAARAFVRNSAPNPILEARTRAVRNLFLRVAEEEQAVYVDLFEEPATDVFLKEPKQYLAFDGLHPSAHGYMLWYRKLIEHIALYIKAPLRNGF
jgi:lysophospholipase L1-like esterase